MWKPTFIDKEKKGKDCLIELDEYVDMETFACLAISKLGNTWMIQIQDKMALNNGLSKTSER